MGRRSQTKHQKQKCDVKLTSNQKKLQQLIDKLLQLTTTPSDETTTKSLELQEDINQIIDEVQTVENIIDPILPVDNRCSGDTVKRFESWMAENGAKFDNVKISEFPGYELGLKAVNDIDESSLIISVPRNLMLTTEVAKKSELGALMGKDPLLKNMPNVSLSLFLLLEKFKKDSFWKSYIDMLPTEYSTVLYFNVDELNELQASPTFDGALKQIKNITRQYAYFYKLIWTSDDAASKILKKYFTFNQYRWAVSTVMTRQNAVPSEDGLELINALIPLWDLCNHTNGKISTNYNAELSCNECLAIKNFKAGEQIFIFYGARSNAELFIHNGFVYEENEYDRYVLRLGISKSDSLRDKRRLLLDRLSLPDHAEFWLKKCNPVISGDLLSFLRIFNMDEDQLQYWLDKREVNNLRNPDCAFDVSFSKKYWNFLINRLKLILATYKTTLEEDFKLMEEGQQTYKMLSIKMRASEKHILKLVIDYAVEQISIL